MTSSANNKNKQPKKWSFQLKFFLIVLALYVLIMPLSKYLVIEAAINTISLLVKIIPMLILVFIFMLAINIFIKPEKIKKYIGHESGLKGWFFAIISGIFISGPPYVLYPMLGELKKSGMSNNFLAVFLYNRNIKIPFIPVMIFYFGLAYTIIISVLIIIFSILNGLIIGRLVKEEKILKAN